MLCEDEVKTFDPKMNHESLARHLQSLRQLYNDLKTDKVKTELSVYIIYNIHTNNFKTSIYTLKKKHLNLYLNNPFVPVISNKDKTFIVNGNSSWVSELLDHTSCCSGT